MTAVRRIKRGPYAGKVIGIVGAEAAKFLPAWQNRARHIIREKIAGAAKVVSGRCPLGGIDIWAIREAQRLGIPTEEYPPKAKSWKFYKARNIQIAQVSDVVLSITVRRYHKNFRGMRFDLCYHCKKTDHIKSGGCWTMHVAERLGKIGELIIIGD